MEYETPEWKKWSTVYCSDCSKPVAHYRGWNKLILSYAVYCKKCRNKIQDEQQKLTEVAEQ